MIVSDKPACVITVSIHFQIYTTIGIYNTHLEINYKFAKWASQKKFNTCRAHVNDFSKEQGWREGHLEDDDLFIDRNSI